MTNSFEITERANISDEVVDIELPERHSDLSDGVYQSETETIPASAGTETSKLPGTSQAKVLGTYQSSLQELTTLVIEKAIEDWWKYPLGLPRGLDSFNPFEEYSQSKFCIKHTLICWPSQWGNLSILGELYLSEEG